MASEPSDEEVNNWIGQIVKQFWTVVVAQLVEWSVPIPQVQGLNPVIRKKNYCTFTVNCVLKRRK